jgi:tripartite motif-containing protein 71
MEGEFVHFFGEKGEAFGQFLYPWDVTTNAAGQIAISDTRNQRVQLFSPQGQFLCVFGGKTMPNVMKELNSPRGLSFTPEGDLLVTDFNKQRMVSILHDFSKMRIINCEVVEEQVGDHWKRRNEQNSELDVNQRYENQSHTALLRPQGVITDDRGNILVADSRHNCIQAFNSFGSLLFIFKPGPEVMGVPLSVAFLCDGRIAIVDDRDRVLLIRLENFQLPQKR